MVRCPIVWVGVSPEREKALAHLAKLPLVERCEFVVNLCEELYGSGRGRLISPCFRYYSTRFGTASNNDCVILGPEVSAKLILRMVSLGGTKAVSDYAVSIGKSACEVLKWQEVPTLYEAELRKGTLLGPDLQEVALQSPSSEMLQWLVRTANYKAHRFGANSMRSCGNEKGVKLLTSRGFNPNQADEKDFVQPLSYINRSAAMVDVLLAHGAKIELLNGKFLPSAVALRRMLQLQPDVTKAKFGADFILRWALYRAALLDYVGVMREFAIALPDMTTFRYTLPDEAKRMPVSRNLDNAVDDADAIAACALFTHNYIKVKSSVAARSPGRGRLLWRPHTHYACDDTRESVMTALLCCKRICKCLPRDIRNLLLLASFGEVRF